MLFSRMKKDVYVYLADIKESIESIAKYTSGDRINEMGSNQQLLDAVIRRLLIIGEVVKKIPDEARELEPSIPWKKIAGTRDVFVHEYKSISPEQVEFIVKNDLPALAEAVARLESKL